MRGKTAIRFGAQRSLSPTPPAGEIVTVLAPGKGTLPRRRSRKGPTTIERFVETLGPLLDKDVTIAELHLTKALEARSPATLRASKNQSKRPSVPLRPRDRLMRSGNRLFFCR